MKKLLSLLVIGLIALNDVYAEDISIDHALQIARQFVMSPSTKQLARGNTPKPITPTLAYTQKSKAGKDNVYVINLGNDQGFVIVSGVSAGEDEVLGYCDHGSFSLFNAPVQLKDLLEGFSGIVDMVRKNPVQTTRAPQEVAADLGKVVVGPLLTTTWDQLAPYNILCPEGCPTGCYPTAIAQVMNFWKWPKESRGKVNREDFSGHVYDWDNMLDNYYTGYTYAQANAVATLMADIGKAFGTIYSPNGSSTSFVHEPLINNFGYNLDYTFGIEQHYADKASDLQNYLRTDLDKKRPVLYTGTGYGLHALVCDGYTSKDYFHFNYGWGGTGDGYYKNAMCGFSVNASIFTGIRPYDPAIQVIGDIKYELVKETGKADILEYTKGGVSVENGALDIPSTVTDEEGNVYKVTNVRQLAFFRKGKFSKITVGENLETVEPFSFMYSYIDTLILNDNLKEVPDEAFAYTKVKNLTIGAAIKRIGKGAFRMCNVREVTCKSPSFIIDDEAFWHPNTTLDGGEWLEHVTYIGKRAFRAARFSKEPNFAILEEIDSLAFEGASMGSSGIGTFYIPPKLKRIVPNAFSLSGATRFIVDEANPYFTNSGYAFVLNKNKTSLVLLSNIQSPITQDLLPFPETMVKLERGSITTRPHMLGKYYYSVEIPATVVEMEGAFCECEHIGDIACMAVIPPVITDSTFNDKIFENYPEITLYVPEGTEELYRNAPGWRRFPEIIGDQEYNPTPEKGREYYMVVHQNGQDLQDVRMPVKEVTDISMNETADGQTSLVVKRAGMDNLTTNIMNVDSITWTPGFVFEDGEVFDIDNTHLTIEAQKCEVTLGKTIIDGPAQMRIRNSVLTPRVVEDIVRGQAVDVALLTDTGEVHQLSGVARIAIPIQRNSDEKVQAAYYNEKTGEWDPVLFRYDEEKSAAVILTDHLSTYSVFAVRNDSTRGTTLSVYDEFSIGYQTLNKALETLFDLVSSDEPEQAAFQKWKSDVGFWQTIGIDGGYNLISGLGFESEFLGECVNVVGYLGTASTVLDVIGDAIRGNDTGVATNTLKAILGFATGQMASAIGTSIMSASMGVSAFIGVALEKFGTTVHELKKAQLNQAYRFYYSPEGQGAVGNQSAYKGLGYRSAKDWFDYFYPAFEQARSHDKLMMLIEQAVHRYTDRFWEETTETFTWCMDAVGERPWFSSTYPYPDKQTQQEISDDYYAELMNNVLPEVFSAIKDKLETKAGDRYHKRQKDYVTVMNTAVAVYFKDSEWEDGIKSQFAGWKLRFTDLPEHMKDKEKWECVLDDKGCGVIGYFSAYSIIKNKMRCNVTLLNPEDEEVATYDFKIPRAKGKVQCYVDLATGGIEVEAPHLNLQLTYDPVELRDEIFFTGKDNNGWDTETGMETIILLDNTFNEKARFQTEIEKFFKQHDYINVDGSGNIRIGEDIVGKFEGNVGKGKLTINTTYSFEENSLEYIRDLVNNRKSMTLAAHALIRGSIQHIIDCEFSVTQRNADGEYEVSYTGEGFYTFNGEIPGTITHVNINEWPNGDQHVTTEDIVTSQLNADGKVALKYDTVIRKNK